jgi:protein-disulfide isomerase
MDRRRFLRTAGLGATATLAGCLGGLTGGDGADGTPSGTPLEEHPAAADLEAQPRRGDLDSHVVLAFEDPSCSRCRAFEQQTVPEIETNLVDPGKGAFVVRTYPVVYQWGKPATQALESTFARDEDAFWSLLGHYFEQQSQFSTDNVLDRTASFLDSNTDLDGAAVRADAENEAHGDAVQADLSAGENAGIGQTTPIVLLFRDGRYVTRASGSVSYETIATALQV